MIAKQRGRNEAFPEVIEWWIAKGGNPPEWLTDRAAIKFVAGSGEITLDSHPTSDGGIEILVAGGEGSILVTTHGPEDYVCFGGGRVFSLRPKQFELLYK